MPAAVYFGAFVGLVPVSALLALLGAALVCLFAAAVEVGMGLESRGVRPTWHAHVVVRLAYAVLLVGIALAGFLDARKLYRGRPELE